MTSREELVRRARLRLASERRRMRDPRFVTVIGRFVRDGLLVVNYDVTPHVAPISVGDVLWAGKQEPRLLELLPALLVKRPAMFKDRSALPDDLRDVVAALRRGVEPSTFRGIAGADVHRWLERVGRVGKLPSRLKSFRFTLDDQRVLTHLAQALNLSETEVIRRALRAMV